ncbi:MAG TPA: DUF2892 domain-containing protein [Chryseosolibacter sp.]
MKNFEETKFAQFMASPAGRITRILAGAGLMILGATQTSAKTKASLLAVGAIPLSAGAFDFCLISPLFKGPFWGSQIRNTKTKLIEVS